MNLVDKKNHEYCQETIALKNHIEGGMFELAKRLYLIKNERRYEPAWSSFTEYLWEIDFDDTKAKRLIGMYQKFILRWGMSAERLSAIGFSKLSVILPHVKTQEEAEEKVAELEKTNMPTHDLRRQIKEEKNVGKVQRCTHEDAYLLKVCPDCGERHRVYDEDNNKQ